MKKKSETLPGLVPFDQKTRSEKGHGFFWKGKEFIHHSTLDHSETALYSFSRAQKITLWSVSGLIVLALILNWHLTLVTAIAAVTFIYFADLLFTCFLIISGLSKRGAISISVEEIADIPDRDWPTYTIFCPLYKEWQVAPQFVKAMSAMDYPSDKLQIMFLLEENDRETVERIRAQKMPPHFEVVVVPHSMPKTKPKAMNFGLNHVRGEYLAIYDAEDVPDPLQLKRAIMAFRQSPPETACVQGKLNFYNPRQNTLTRIFTAEYSLWFDLILPGLQSIDAPIPLGGTSNHFKVSLLRELEGWDAFNVTEDCDLGMRMAKRGFRTRIIDSTTQEEANSDSMNWYNQRSRWIKGYIQTYLVHMRDPKKFFERGGIRDLVTFQLVVGTKILALFVNPFMWAITIAYFAFRSTLGPGIESLFPMPVFYVGIVCLVFGNFLYLYNYMIAAMRRDYGDIIKYVFIVPFYWLGMSIAAWKALYEIFVKPHYWAKTVHGLHLVGKAAEQVEALVGGNMLKPGFAAKTI